MPVDATPSSSPLTRRPGSGLSLSVLDLATIRKLLEQETSSDTCPSCNMPFDKGKKRKLIDTCGHERCYACMFRNEACPLCAAAHHTEGHPTKKSLGCSTLDRGSELTLYGEVKGAPPRPKVKTNGHFTSYMQSRQESPSSEWQSPSRLPKTRPSPSRSLHRDSGNCCQPGNVMTQSCPTPPQSRRRFFLSPKVLRNPWNQRGSRGLTDSADTPSALSDDEGGTVKPVTPHGASSSGSAASGKKGSHMDLYMRLGLLLGEGARRNGSGNGVSSNGTTSARRSPAATSNVIKRGISPAAQSPPRRAGAATTANGSSFSSSLASLEAHTLASTNTSPVSTLTGSSEADVHSRGATLKDPSSDSVTSLMSVSEQSNCSSSPLSRRHSVTTSQPGQVEELNVFKNRRASIRRSARTGSVKGPIDPKVRFAQYRQAPQLTLKPLFFEVPLQESDPLFVGRHWLVREMEEALGSGPSGNGHPGILVVGGPGTGKTALILQLVEFSCFGRRRGRDSDAGSAGSHHSAGGIYCQMNLVSDRLRHLASHVVAYHFCQADNNNTCLVPDFIHSLAAQLCQAPQLVAYREYLLSEPHLQGAVSLRECIADPDLAFSRGVLEPLGALRRVGKIANENCIILVDALCEAEYHRPDHGDTLASFLARHAADFPPWLKVVATVRTQLADVDATQRLPLHRINLDKLTSNENLQKDLLDYINFRLANSPSIQSNVASTSGKLENAVPGSGQFRFSQHLLGLSKGSFLFAKLTLDLIERGHLVAKSSGYKVLPVSLAQIFLLHFNLRFPTARSFERVAPILTVCLAALYPLTLIEIFYSVNALKTEDFISWEDFMQSFKLLSGFLVKRLDNTYMLFHPSFREWLMRRDEGESTKFVCDLRQGHSAIAFRLSRVQPPLDAEHTLELGHHILKAHIYKNMTLHRYSSRDLQAHWVASSTEDTSLALCTMRNIYSPNVKVSRLLLLAGADPDFATEFLGQAPALCMYAHEGCAEMVALLLEFGADCEASNSQGCTALSLAAARGHCEVVRQLVAAGASLGHADTAGQCPLVHAARNGKLNVVGYLLACDWVLNKPEDEVELAEAAQQALVAASAQGHTEIVEYLLDMAEVRPDVPDALTGETALTVAAANGCPSVCSALLSRGASVSALNRKETPALVLAVREGHWAVAERLLQQHAPLEQCDPLGRTPLMLAAAEGHVALIELLLDKGASMERIDRDGVTALGWACLRGRVQAAQCMLDRGAVVNHADKTGRTPLDLAALQGNPGVVQLLLERGAMLEHVDINGLRPLDRAISYRNTQVVHCFLRKGAKLGPATWAMAAGKPEILLILLNKLLEDGNVLYRKMRLKEAAHRYQYALKKFPTEDDAGPESKATFEQLRVNFLLNQSRCKRKMNEHEEAIELANQVLKLRSDSFEAYYARAKARIDLKNLSEAQADVEEALRVAPAHNRELRRVLARVRDEIQTAQADAIVPAPLEEDKQPKREPETDL